MELELVVHFSAGTEYRNQYMTGFLGLFIRRMGPCVSI